VFPKRRGILKEYIAPLGRVKKKLPYQPKSNIRLREKTYEEEGIR
jgi:hypothetical protein